MLNAKKVLGLVVPIQYEIFTPHKKCDLPIGLLFTTISYVNCQLSPAFNTPLLNMLISAYLVTKSGNILLRFVDVYHLCSV